MYSMEEQQLTIDQSNLGDRIVTAELILVNIPEGSLTRQVSDKKGMATATIHITGIVKENPNA